MFSSFSFRDLQECLLLGESINESEYGFCEYIQISPRSSASDKCIRKTKDSGHATRFPTLPNWLGGNRARFLCGLVFYLILFHFGTFFRFN